MGVVCPSSDWQYNVRGGNDPLGCRYDSGVRRAYYGTEGAGESYPQPGATIASLTASALGRSEEVGTLSP